jgi:hypothetical protein
MALSNLSLQSLLKLSIFYSILGFKPDDLDQLSGWNDLARGEPLFESHQDAKAFLKRELCIPGIIVPVVGLNLTSVKNEIVEVVLERNVTLLRGFVRDGVRHHASGKISLFGLDFGLGIAVASTFLL